MNRFVLWLFVTVVAVAMVLCLPALFAQTSSQGGQVPLTTQITYVVIGKQTGPDPPGNGNGNENENENENENDNGTAPVPDPCIYEDLTELNFYVTTEPGRSDPGRKQQGAQNISCRGPGQRTVTISFFDLDQSGEAILRINDGDPIVFATDRSCDKTECSRSINYLATQEDVFTFLLDPCPDSWPHCPGQQHSGYYVDRITVTPQGAPAGERQVPDHSDLSVIPNDVVTVEDGIPPGWAPVPCVAVRFTVKDQPGLVLGRSWSSAAGYIRLNLPYGLTTDDVEWQIIGVLCTPPDNWGFDVLRYDDFAELRLENLRRLGTCSKCGELWHTPAWCPNDH